MTMKSNIMKKGLGILTCLLLIYFLSPGLALADEKYEEKFEKTEKLEKDGKVYIRNISGKIEVKSWDEDQVKIDALKISKAPTLAKAEENAKKVTIEVNRVGNVLRIETKYPESKKGWGHEHDGLNVSIDYSLWIPNKASLEVKSVSGNLAAEKIGGSLDADLISGTITVVRAEKGAECKTVSGNIDMQDVMGDVYLKSVSGTIKVMRIEGSIDAETTSGHIRLEEVSGAKVVKAKVLSGGIFYRGKINPDGRYNLDSLSGNVEMRVPQHSGFEFEADSFSGHVDTDFPVEVTGKIPRGELRGVINKGGATVRLKTFSGNIRLMKE